MVESSKPPLLLLLIGLPGCGKTTLASSILKLNPTSKHICFDLLQGGLQTTESWHQAKQTAFELCQHSNANLIILDDNFEYKSMRKPYFKLAQERHIGYIELHFTISLDQSLQRIK